MAVLTCARCRATFTDAGEVASIMATKTGTCTSCSSALEAKPVAESLPEPEPGAAPAEQTQEQQAENESAQ